MKIRVMVIAAALAGAACASVQAGTEPPAGELAVSQRFDRSAGRYIEGSYSYIRVTQDGRTVVDERIAEQPVENTLAPGSYVLESYQRPCDGNCGTLDAPTDQCSAPFSMSSGERVRLDIVVTPGKGCAISVG